MKKKFKEIIEIDTTVANLYAKNPALKETKFGYAYTQFYKKNYEPTAVEYREALKMMYVDYAMEDEKTHAVILDEKSRTGYGHNKEGWKEIMKEEKALSDKFEAMEIEVEPYLSSYIPEEATPEEVGVLMGFVL